MGWSNYIVVDDWKMMFEISRHIREDDLDFINEKLKKIEILHEDLSDMWMDDDKEITLYTCSISDFSKRWLHSEYCESFFSLCDYYLDVFMFLNLLKSYNVHYRIISEYELDSGDDKDLNKKYKVVHKYYGD